MTSLKIYYLDIHDKLREAEVTAKMWGAPHEVAHKAATEGFSLKTPETEGQLDYYPPHRVLKVVVL